MFLDVTLFWKYHNINSDKALLPKILTILRKHINNYIAYGRTITIKTICSKQKCVDENCDSAYI